MQSLPHYGLYSTTAIRMAQKALSMVKSCDKLRPKDFFDSPRGEFTGISTLFLHHVHEFIFYRHLIREV